MFHRVLPQAELNTHILQRPRFETSDRHFERVLMEMKSDGYRFVSLDHMMRRIEERRGVEWLACITFDDGFSDIVRHALPLLERHEAPFTVYVTTGYPDGELLHISAAIEELVLNRERLELDLPSGRLSLDTSTSGAKASAVRHLENAVLSQFSGIMPAARALGFTQASCRPCTLTWEQLATLALHPLCALGAHTVTHRDLTLATPAEVRWELEESNRRLALHTGVTPVHFAYPFGRYDEQVREQALRAGYRVIVKTGRACIDPTSLDWAAVPRACALEAMPQT